MRLIATSTADTRTHGCAHFLFDLIIILQLANSLLKRPFLFDCEGSTQLGLLSIKRTNHPSKPSQGMQHDPLQPYPL